MAKGSTSKKGKGSNGDANLPKQLEKEDLQGLQLLFKERENLLLKKQVLESQVPEIAEINAQINATTAKLAEENTAVNEKYKLNVEVDRIDINTGEITRG